MMQTSVGLEGKAYCFTEHMTQFRAVIGGVCSVPPLSAVLLAMLLILPLAYKQTDQMHTIQQVFKTGSGRLKAGCFNFVTF